MLPESTPLPRKRPEPAASADPAARMPPPAAASRTSVDAAPGAVARARELVLAHGWNATAYQILNPGLAYWFARAGDAVAGFVRHRGVRVVAGAPVCAAERLPGAMAELEESAAATGETVCYFHAGERLEAVARERGNAVVVIGAQPNWDPADWPGALAHRGSWRAQLNRARNKGVAVEEWSAARAAASPALRRCLSDWLATRRLPPLHFLVEPDTLDRLFDRRVFVAARGGSPVAFLIASPIPARGGWLIEQIVRGHQAPNGSSELLIDAAMRALAADGARFATLGLVPLSRRIDRGYPMPLWLRMTLRWVRAHGRRFYNFTGLEAFKSKLLPPVWEPVFAVTNTAEFTPGTLYAIAGAFGGGSPVALVRHALKRAAVQEARWVAQRVVRYTIERSKRSRLRR